MTNVTGAAVMTEADPQAAVLAKLAAIIAPNIKVEDVQTALTVFVALAARGWIGLRYVHRF